MERPTDYRLILAMIEVSDARKLLAGFAQTLPSEEVATEWSLNRVLFSDIISIYDHPFFDHSAVDGYAFAFSDLVAGNSFRLVGAISAGQSYPEEIRKGETIRIFTGAPLPPGTDTVIMQEKVTVEGEQIVFHDAGLKAGGNVRRKGEQLKAGSCALQKGLKLTPALIGFLKSLGNVNVQVSQQPIIAVVVTGNEFVEEGESPADGKIVESNSAMLFALLSEQGIHSEIHFCRDNLDQLTALIHSLSSQVDLILVTGGASVGDFDFTRPALEAAGFHTVFHNVNQKPGKPLLFAANGSKAAFGLPGNPRAVILCYYLYVLPLLYQMQGCTQSPMKTIELPLTNSYSKKDGKTHFVTSRLTDSGVEITGGQASHMLQSFSDADAIAELPSEISQFSPGDRVKLYLM